jgi:thiol-disulfide isomerase/thioredoxin
VLAALGVVALLVLAFVVVRWAASPAPNGATSDDQAVGILTAIPSTVLDQVGVGTATPRVVRILEPDLVGPHGRPAVLYVGAEFCPYCAAERWPLIVALSRFGALSGLRTTSSSTSDVFPGTPTFSFAGATYTGSYVDLVAVEQDAGPAVLLSTSERDVVQRYGAGGIPFIDLGNRAALAGATYSPDLLQGLTRSEIARDLLDPASPHARAILGSANLLTAGICLETGQQPAGVCSSAGVRAAVAALR